MTALQDAAQATGWSWELLCAFLEDDAIQEAIAEHGWNVQRAATDEEGVFALSWAELGDAAQEIWCASARDAVLGRSDGPATRSVRAFRAAAAGMFVILARGMPELLDVDAAADEAPRVIVARRGTPALAAELAALAGVPRCASRLAEYLRRLVPLEGDAALDLALERLERGPAHDHHAARRFG